MIPHANIGVEHRRGEEAAQAAWNSGPFFHLNRGVRFEEFAWRSFPQSR